MPTNTSSGDTPFDAAHNVREQAASRAAAARDAISDMSKTASEKASEFSRAASEKASEYSKAAGEKASEFASAAADRLNSTADYVRSHDAKRMASDVETMVKNNPGPALAVAAAFGFLIGRAMSRD